MSKFDRYMLSQFLMVFGFFTLVLVAMFWINKAVRMFNWLVGDGHTALVFLEFTTLTLPAVIGVVLPLSTFAAVVYVANRLTAESELTVIQATGYSAWRLMRSVIFFGTLTALFMTLLMHVLIPMSQSTLAERRAEISENVTAKFLKEGEFLHPARNITLFIQAITPEGELQNVLLSDRRDAERQVVYSSKRAYLVRNSDSETAKMVMVDGIAQSHTPADNRLFTSEFRDFSYDIGSLTSPGQANLINIRFASSVALLLAPQATASAYGVSLGTAMFELHNRIAQSLVCLVAALIGFTTLLTGGFSRFGVWWQITTAFLLLVFVKMLESSVGGIVLGNGAAWPVMYLPFGLGLGLWGGLLFAATYPAIMRRLNPVHLLRRSMS